MGCNCSYYEVLELNRKSISDRIKCTKQIIRELILISKFSSEYRLYRCEVCGQLWQASFAWNWANKEYLFKVPDINIDSWILEPFMSPDKMLIFSAVMEDYFNKNSSEASEKKCRRDGCTQMALVDDVLCKEHFINNLQSSGILPKQPIGHIFPPYYIKSSTNSEQVKYLVKKGEI